MPPVKIYVGLAQQGMILDQKLVGVSHDEDAVRKAADSTAGQLNGQITGETEGWVSTVLELELQGDPHDGRTSKAGS